MPIRSEHRHHYRTPAWRAVCEIVDARAQGRCEHCGCPAGLDIIRLFGATSPGGSERRMYWRLWGYPDARWIDNQGEETQFSLRPELWAGPRLAKFRRIKVQLGHAHLNQNPADNSPDNVRLLCRYCHILHDAPVIAEHAADTRKTRKDATRPLLLTPNSEAGDPPRGAPGQTICGGGGA